MTRFSKEYKLFFPIMLQCTHYTFRHLIVLWSFPCAHQHNGHKTGPATKITYVTIIFKKWQVMRINVALTYMWDACNPNSKYASWMPVSTKLPSCQSNSGLLAHMADKHLNHFCYISLIKPNHLVNNCGVIKSQWSLPHYQVAQCRYLTS